MAKTKIRGSELLKQHWTNEDLIHLIELDHDGIELTDFFPIGIPAPDGGWGTWRVQPQALSALIQAVLKGKVVPVLHVFPKGIPVPDFYEVAFEAGSARTH